MLQCIPIVDVYIAAVPENEPIGYVECKARRDEISSISNEKVKREKYFVWQLLCYALEHSFGLRREELDFTKESYGGWSVAGVKLSLSHSDGAVAVAVSREAVGIDIERVHRPRAQRIAERIMTDAELVRYERTPPEQRQRRLIEIWTAKEAIFKSKQADSFIPRQHDTLTESFLTNAITLSGEEYVYSVASAITKSVRIFTDIDLSK